MPLPKKFFRVNRKLKLRQIVCDSNHSKVYHLRPNQDRVGYWSTR